jgi:hypothetical protein
MSSLSVQLANLASKARQVEAFQNNAAVMRRLESLKTAAVLAALKDARKKTKKISRSRPASPAREIAPAR